MTTVMLGKNASISLEIWENEIQRSKKKTLFVHIFQQVFEFVQFKYVNIFLCAMKMTAISGLIITFSLISLMPDCVFGNHSRLLSTIPIDVTDRVLIPHLDPLTAMRFPMTCRIHNLLIQKHHQITLAAKDRLTLVKRL